MFKNSLKLLMGVLLAIGVTGCLFVEHDDRWHHDHDRMDHPDHHDHYDHHDDPAIDVHFHG